MMVLDLVRLRNPWQPIAHASRVSVARASSPAPLVVMIAVGMTISKFPGLLENADNASSKRNRV